MPRFSLRTFLLPPLLLPLCLAAAPSHDNSPARPQLEDYRSQNEFVKDLLAWQRQQRQAKADGAAENIRPQPDPHDWHHITGPEKLDEALHNAYGYVQPNYTEKYRYNRTTHLSFPLESLPAGQLSRQAIDGGLQDIPADSSRSLQPLPELRSILEEAGELTNPGTDLESRQLDTQLPPVSQRVEFESVYVRPN